MIKGIVAFVVLFVILVVGRMLLQEMTSAEKWDLTKIMIRSIITSVVVIAILTFIVVLF
jgi:protein-S-isoprenylcysteine O-methyltransferase Ste14